MADAAMTSSRPPVSRTAKREEVAAAPAVTLLCLAREEVLDSGFWILDSGFSHRKAASAAVDGR